jgi:hypothetical protein
MRTKTVSTWTQAVQKPQELAALGAFVLCKLLSLTKLWVVCSTARLRQIIPVLNLLCQVQIQEPDPKLQYAAANCEFLLDSLAANTNEKSPHNQCDYVGFCTIVCD